MSKIRLSKSCIGDAEVKSVMRVLDKSYFGMGEEVKKFEDELSIFVGRTALCVVNGTAALHLALQAAGIGHGDEVLVQSVTYVASFQAIKATGATPIACDVNPATLTIDLKDAKEKITKKTKAIMPVHYAGCVGNIDDIYDFAHKNNLRIIEDAAHAFGTEYNGKKVGSNGDICCFSFDGIKNITSGEGGCIISSDDEIISKIKDSRLLGVEDDTENRFKGTRSWDPDVKLQGWRYHMSDIMAAIGREQLKNFDFHKTARQFLAKLYVSKIKDKIKSIKLLEHNYDEIVPHIFVIILPENCNRDNIRSNLSKIGIPTGIHYKPNHLLTYFKNTNQNTLINTNSIYKRLLTLPLHPDLQETDINFIVDSLHEELIND